MTFTTVVVSALVVAVVTAMALVNWKTAPIVRDAAVRQNDAAILRPELRLSGQIDVIDGDTIRHQREAYRLVGFDTPVRGDWSARRAPSSATTDGYADRSLSVAVMLGRS